MHSALITVYVLPFVQPPCVFLHLPVFIYSMPGYSCSIKERMLYSSCKGPLLDAVEQQMGIEVVRKVHKLIHYTGVYSLLT